jgi:hypothetical protein
MSHRHCTATPASAKNDSTTTPDTSKSN